MSIDAIKNAIPEYAKDLKLNLSSLSRDTTLTEQQLWGSLVASAHGARNAALVEAIEADAASHLTPEALQAARAAAAVMAMNNVYYRFVHLASNEEYGTLKAGLRMNVIANPGVERVDFELWSLAVSAVNGCGMCIDSHEQVLRNGGVNAEAVQTAVRVAAVVNAIAAVFDSERIATSDLAAAA